MNADDVQIRNIVIDGKDAGQIVVHSQTTIQDVMTVMEITDISHSGSTDSAGNFIFSSKIALTFFSWKKSLDSNARVTNDQYVLRIIGEPLFHDSVFFAPSLIDNRHYFGFSKSASQFGLKNLACGNESLINFVNRSIYFFGTTSGIFGLQKSLIYDTKSSIGFIPSGILCDNRSSFLDFHVIREFIEHIKFKTGLKLNKESRQLLDTYLGCKSWSSLLSLVPKPTEPVVELVDREKLVHCMLKIGVEDYGKVVQIVQEEMVIKTDENDEMDLDIYELSENLCKKLWDCFAIEEMELELSVPVQYLPPPPIVSMDIESIQTTRYHCVMEVEFEDFEFKESLDRCVRRVVRKREREESAEDEDRLYYIAKYSTESEFISILGDCLCGIKKAKILITKLFELERISEDAYDALLLQRCRAPGWRDFMEEMWEEYCV